MPAREVARYYSSAELAAGLNLLRSRIDLLGKRARHHRKVHGVDASRNVRLGVDVQDSGCTSAKSSSLIFKPRNLFGPLQWQFHRTAHALSCELKIGDRIQLIWKRALNKLASISHPALRKR